MRPSPTTLARAAMTALGAAVVAWRALTAASPGEAAPAGGEAAPAPVADGTPARSRQRATPGPPAPKGRTAKPRRDPGATNRGLALPRPGNEGELGDPSHQWSDEEPRQVPPPQRQTAPRRHRS
jgi:hypothetical protein